MDISYGMPVYKGRESKRPILKVECNFETGSVYETRLDMNLHTGTHIDAPLHMIENGASINSLEVGRTVGKCRVIDMTWVTEKIGRKELEGRNIRNGEFILLKTRNSFMDILEGPFVYLDDTGAQLLKFAGISGVGIDGLGIEREQPGHETHRTLMEAGIVIMEGLRLKDAEEGEYLLAAAPLKISGAEAAPARALLIRDLPKL